MKLLIQLTRILLLLCVIAFGIKWLKEPDVWWMLRTGEWIVQQGEVITKDYFSFTFYEESWINVKWLFEVILYGFAQVGGPEFTPIIQCLVYGLLFIFLEKRYRLNSQMESEAAWRTTAFTLIGIIALIAIEFRMLGRPEMISHLFSVIFLLVFENYRKSPSAIIWWLLPIQVLWVNLHEAYGIGLVMVVTMLIGSFIDRYFSNKALDKRLIIASLFTILAIGINPRGLKMILHPFEIFSQVGLNKYTIELVGFTDSLFWRKEAYLLLVFFVLGVIALIQTIGGKKNSIKVLIISYGSGWLGLFVLFFYLGFTAYRNIPFFIIFTTPLIATLIYNKGLSLSHQLKNSLLALVALILIGLYCLIITNTYYNLTNRKATYGLKVSTKSNPVGVADFLQKLSLNGNGFSDYLTSSYLMWDLRPNFKTYIDLRDLDVFSKSFFDNYLEISGKPELFEIEDEKYDFNYAIVYSAKFDGLHHYLDRSKEWEMVYADNIAALYLKRNSSNTPIIDSLFSIQVGTVFNQSKSIKTSNIALSISTIFNPLYDESKADYTADYDLLGAIFFNRIRDYNAALYQCKLSIKNRGEQPVNLALLGQIYLSLSQAVDKSMKDQVLEEAKLTYTKLMNQYPTESTGYKGLGFYYSAIGNNATAVQYFNRSNSIEYDEDIARLLINLQ